MIDYNVPPCRDGQPETEREQEADRAVLYGACLLVLRPNTRIKPHLQEAVHALAPAIQAYYSASDVALAEQARAYATVCGGQAFLDTKAAEYRRRQG